MTHSQRSVATSGASWLAQLPNSSLFVTDVLFNSIQTNLHGLHSAKTGVLQFGVSNYFEILDIKAFKMI